MVVSEHGLPKQSLYGANFEPWSHGQPKKKKKRSVLIGTPWDHNSLPILIKAVISVCPGNWKPRLSCTEYLRSAPRLYSFPKLCPLAPLFILVNYLETAAIFLKLSACWSLHKCCSAIFSSPMGLRLFWNYIRHVCGFSISNPTKKDYR